MIPPPFRLSKKLTMAVLTTLFIVINKRFDMGFDDATVATIAGVVAAYLVGQGVADVAKIGRPS